VLLDGTDRQDGNEAARDRGGNIFPGGGGGIEH
jgi:hypothetical protein